MSKKKLTFADMKNAFDALERTMRSGSVAVTQEGMEYRPIHSDAARHIAEKIRQSTWAGAADFNVITLFERKKVWVMLDLDAAKEFVEEVEHGTNLAAEGGRNQENVSGHSMESPLC